MIGLIQRVTEARVVVSGDVVGEIGPGILLLLGVEAQDECAQAERLLQKVLGYRIFEDEAGKMNRSLRDTAGGLLVVSQFTLVADTRKGLRPSFSSGASAEKGEALYTTFLNLAKAAHPHVASGRYAADMKVFLCNDGPATFWLTA